MANVFYTDVEFRPGETIDTRGYRAANLGHLAELPPEHGQVEALLEDVRQELEVEGRRTKHTHGEEFRRVLPERLSSIVVIPWPDDYVTEMYDDYQQGWIRKRVPVPDPPGEGAWCYYVRPLPETVRIIADEQWVDELVLKWARLRGTSRARKIALDYWDGQPRWGAGLEVRMSALLQGPVLVEAVCVGDKLPLP